MKKTIITAIIILGFALSLIGIVLLVAGFHSIDAFYDKYLEKLTGRYSEETMAYLISGISSVILGFSTIFGGIITLFIKSQTKIQNTLK